MFVNISMGEGQEAPAALKMDELATKGGWIMLQNVHLMQDWLPILERHLELLSEHSHEDFRVFLSAEPPAFGYVKSMLYLLVVFVTSNTDHTMNNTGSDSLWVLNLYKHVFFYVWLMCKIQ